MIVRISTLVLVFLTALALSAQEVALSGVELNLPQGNVIGADFGDSVLFIQQSVLKETRSGITSTRQLVVSDLDSGNVRAIQTIQLDTALLPNRCGRVQADITLQRVIICSDDAVLSLIDTDTLKLASSFHVDGQVDDFAVDQSLHRVFVLLRRAGGQQFLSSYDLIRGTLLNQIQISGEEVSGAEVVINWHTRRIAIANLSRKFGTALYSCRYSESSLACDGLMHTTQISQIAVAGSELLAASGVLNDDRKVCLTRIDLNEKRVDDPFCSPDTGVHYAVGIVGGHYAIAYTGTSKRLHFKEETVPVSSSVSLWDIESHRLVSRASQLDSSGLQQGTRISCSTAGPRCFVYSLISNIGYVYTVVDGRHTPGNLSKAGCPTLRAAGGAPFSIAEMILDLPAKTGGVPYPRAARLGVLKGHGRVAHLFYRGNDS